MDKKDIQEYLIKKLDENYDIEQTKVVFKEKESSKKILEIRDSLMVIGLITEEDLEHNVYVADIKAGIGGFSSAHVAMMLDEGKLYVASYVKEGFFKQGISTKAIDKIFEVV